MRVLGAIGPEAEAAIPELNRLMLEFKEPAAAAEALGAIGAASIKVLNAAAAHDNADMRILAVHALFRTGAAGVPALIDLVGSKHDNVRSRATILLGNVQTRDKSVINALGLAARDKDANVRLAALRSIGVFGPSATAVESQVVALLIDDHQNVRFSALDTLKAIGVDPIPAFKKGLNHADPATRIKTAFTMFEHAIELNLAEAALMDGLKEKDVKLKLMSAHALAMRRMHVDDALPILIERLKQGDAADRQNACQAIFYYGDQAKKAGPALVTALDDTDGIVVGTALRTLRSTVDDPKIVLPAMLKLLRADDDTWHPQASQYFFEFGPNAIDDVIAILKKEKAPGVRLACLQTLAMIGPPANNAVGDLTKALDDTSPRARLSAVRALGNIGPDAKPALDALTKAEKDTDVSVKQMATVALAQIKTQPNPVEFVVHGALTPGDPVDRVHSTSFHVVHYYSMKAGTKHQIDLTSKWIGILRVESAQGSALAQKAEPALLTFVAPADGWYRVVVTSLTPQTSGPYSLRVKKIE
jgi:HEAT repeat protein